MLLTATPHAHDMTPAPMIRHRHIDVDGIDVFFRESGEPSAPTLLLLHGFPSASHQFRRLIEQLAVRYHVVAPDYPGFGHSEAPAPASAGGVFTYTFDRLAEVVERFVDRLGLERVYAYVFDFGAPIAFRIAERRPELFAGFISQNGNAYEAGLSPAMHGPAGETRAEAEARLRGILTLAATRDQYESGAADPELIDPDSWTLDQRVLDLPGRDRIMLDLLLDYGSNIARYPTWQAWLREHQPPLLLVWGSRDPFFLPAGAEAYLAEVPDAELHLFETGHFALEEHVGDIAPLIVSFIDPQEGTARASSDSSGSSPHTRSSSRSSASTSSSDR